MPVFVLIIGAVLLVAALNNTQHDLAAALEADGPPFLTWAAAIFGLGALGFVPGLKPVSRGLLALVFVVIILKNYKNILTGFSDATKQAQSFAVNTNTSSGPITFGGGGSSDGGGSDAGANAMKAAEIAATVIAL